MLSVFLLLIFCVQLITSNLIIFDHDGGVDDIHALVQLIEYHINGIHELIGVTTVRGNMELDTVFNTTRSMINLFSQQIPTFKGCDSALVDTPKSEELIFHGPNGTGNYTFPTLAFNNKSSIDDRHASLAIIDLIKKYKKLDANNKIDIIAVGPLTNIALAFKLYPNIFKSINSLWIMGGLLYGKGNFNWLTEFNFANDVEAAKIVLDHSHLVKMYIVPFDSIPWIKYDTFMQLINEITNDTETYDPFMTNMIVKLNEFFKQLLESDTPFPGWLFPDFYTTTAYLYYNQMIEQEIIDDKNMNIIYVNADIEMYGKYSRGALAINWIEYMFQTSSLQIGKVGILESINVDLILHEFKQLCKFQYESCKVSNQHL